MSVPLVYMIRADFSPDYMEEHHRWYARRHAPDLMSAGFWSTRGYDSPTSPILWNIYEVPDVAIFSSDAYKDSHRADPFLETAVKHLQGRTVSLYTQLRAVDGSGTELRRYPTLRGPVLTSLRFHSGGDAAAVQKWFLNKVVAGHRGVKGVRTVRLWEQREAHPKWPSVEPRWSVGIEWESERAVSEADGRARLESAATDDALRTSGVKVDVTKKRYGLVREDVFEE